MLFVLEGCDGSGKTTVANHLKSILPDAEIVHCTTDTPNDYEFFKNIIVASQSRHIIADRFCYGQFIYQAPKERHLSDRELTLLETEMIAHSARVIHVAAPIKEIEDRLSLRGEKTTLSVSEICDRYIDLFENKSLIKPYLWWTGHTD